MRPATDKCLQDPPENGFPAVAKNGENGASVYKLSGKDARKIESGSLCL